MLAPGNGRVSGHSPGYKSYTHKTELRSCDSITHRIHPQRKGAERQAAAERQVPMLAPGNGRVSGHSPGYKSYTHKTELR